MCGIRLKLDNSDRLSFIKLKTLMVLVQVPVSIEI